MHLTRLELSGFKSFARKTVLEFPSRITGVVGPNGSGKTNIKDALQWVLGEQSIKSLRGKKGEDMIWNGSPPSKSLRQTGAPRMGKASVTLFFDNQDKKIPIEFEEVALARKIFRDGANEYLINDSPVRMRDFIMLTAQMGLGETKHNIIGQGEVDRALMASPRERRLMLEEALGLRAYRLKKREAERKLEQTKANIKQVESLIREITPHLKFLRIQAEKAEGGERMRQELEQMQRAYWSRELGEIVHEKNRIAIVLDPLIRRADAIQEEVRRLSAMAKELEGAVALRSRSMNEEMEQAVRELERTRRDLDREIGRLDGKIESEREKNTRADIPARARVIDTDATAEEIRGFLATMRAILTEENLSAARTRIEAMLKKLDLLLNNIEQGMSQEETVHDQALAGELEHARALLREEAIAISGKLETLAQDRIREHEEYRAAHSRMRQIELLMRGKQDEERAVTLERERIRIAEDQTERRNHELKQELASAGVAETELASAAAESYQEFSHDGLRQKIERLRDKLEEIGGIDTAVIAEYQETSARYAFLTKELEDVRKAALSLQELICELEAHLKKDFREGFIKINKAFEDYFQVIFGGGKAALRIVKCEVPSFAEAAEGAGITEENGLLSESLADEGVEIEVDVPRKRIHGLAMLSGGERALTSVALLFAMTAINPPPFLILDETDAALDEANSQRYSTILTGLARITQLIVITHNRETMKAADVLYGVTMGDDGVSKLLSLRFADAEQFTHR